MTDSIERQYIIGEFGIIRAIIELKGGHLSASGYYVMYLKARIINQASVSPGLTPVTKQCVDHPSPLTFSMLQATIITKIYKTPFFNIRIF